MGLNRPFDRPMFVIGGAVKTTGGSQNLQKGQLALVDNSRTTPDGVQVVSTTAGKQKDLKHFALRLGNKDVGNNRSRDNFAQSTMNFSLNEVVGLRVSAPERTEQSLDEVIIGYDGIDPNTSFNFRRGDDLFRWTLELEGGGIEWRGSKNCKEVLSVNVQIPECDPFENCEQCDECAAVDCRAVVIEAIERMKRRQLTGGSTVADYVDITPVFSCTASPAETPYQYYSIDVCDTGSDEALSLIAAQYDAPVIRINRRGSTSTYQILLPVSAGAPDDYEQTIASIIKGCSDCPAGFDPVVGGYLYAFTGPGTAAAFNSAIQGLPGYSSNSLVNSGSSAGINFATAILTAELTSAQITTFLGVIAGATVNLVGDVADICENDSVSSISWVEGEICNVTEEAYYIDLPDNECGEDRLVELQGAYPELTIVIADSDESTQTVTLTGTSGTANVTIDSVDYLATFATDLTLTASNFVTAHAADILAAHGLVVTADAGVLSFTGTTVGFLSPTITNASGNLAGTVGTLTVVPFREACQTRYEATVVSNMVCEECDPIFKDYYVTSAPEAYEFTHWTAVETSEFTNGDCLCGIRIKGKPFVLNAEEALRDQINFVEDSVRIQTAAGYPNEVREGIGRLPKGTYPVKRLSRFIPRTHLGGNLRDLENEGRKFGRDLNYSNDYLARLLTGTTTNIEDQLTQYVHYTLTISHQNHAGGFARRGEHSINWDIYVEVGRHQAVEDLLNNIAANAGVSTVQAFA